MVTIYPLETVYHFCAYFSALNYLTFEYKALATHFIVVKYV